jgi:hypothetical protein
MAKRTADRSLVTGAAVANRNYDNAPGMYSGLDKLGKKGLDLMEKGIKKKEDDREKIEKQNKSWDIISQDALKNMGSFKSSTDRDLSLSNMKKAKELWMTGEKELAAQMMNKEKSYIDGVLDKRVDYANNMSAAMDARDGELGSNGREKEIHTAYLQENYKVKEVGGERVYSGTTENGHEFSMTADEIDDIFIPQVPQYAVSFNKVFTDEYNTSKFNENVVKNKIHTAMPKTGDVKGLRGFISDEIRLGQNFEAMLDSDEGLRAEVNKALEGNETWDTDGTAGISDDEFAAYKRSIVDPYAVDAQGNSFWKGNMSSWEKAVRPIITDKLYQAVENENRLAYPDNYKVEGNNDGEDGKLNPL